VAWCDVGLQGAAHRDSNPPTAGSGDPEAGLHVQADGGVAQVDTQRQRVIALSSLPGQGLYQRRADAFAAATFDDGHRQLGQHHATVRRQSSSRYD
jgi:hypothetical protein